MGNVLSFYSDAKEMVVVLDDGLLDQLGDQYQNSNEKTNGYTFEQYAAKEMRRLNYVRKQKNS